MRIYSLTALGQSLSKNTRSPYTPSWRIIHFLAKRDAASDDQIVEFTGLNKGVVSGSLRSLQAKRFVKEVGNDNRAMVNAMES
jgi:DNA-binding MarR family transcriptional regulator